MKLKNLIVLVAVAPFAPYPALYSRGPRSTWVNDLDKCAKMRSYSGLPLSRRRRWMTDLRDSVRFPGISPQDIRTVDPTSLPLRAYATLLHELKLEKSVGTENRDQRTQLAQRFVVTVLKGTNQLCKWFARFEGRYIERHSKCDVAQAGLHYLSPRPATMTNHLRIQRDVMHKLLSDTSIDGFLFCTASVYISWTRMRDWIERQCDDLDFAAVAVPDVTGRMYGGTVTYFSRRGASSLVETDELDYGSLQDVAINDWLNSSGIGWLPIPVSRFDDTVNDDECPLCVNSTAIAAICTSHPDRERESRRMQYMHDHELSHYP